MRYDDNIAGEWQEFESDRWYHLQHRVVMNTPTVTDGIVQAWLDGEMVLDRQDIRWRDVSTFGIDNFFFSTFFGGSSTKWEATKDEFVYYDDFIISTTFIVPEPSSAIMMLLCSSALFGLRTRRRRT